MKSQNTKSSDELQQDVRHELRNVRKDLDVMSSRLSPGQLIDDVIFYPHGRNPGATFDHLKRNPVGTAFLSLGTILLMENDSGKTLESISGEKLQSARQKMKMGPSSRELAMDKVNEYRDKVDELKSEMEYKVAAARDKIDTMKEKVEQRIESARGEFPGAHELPGKEELSSLKNRVSGKIHDLDNVTFMALGAGLGVLTGASLPLSESESSFVSDKLGDKLSGLSGDLQSAINECSNILKDLVISDVKDMKVDLFK